MLDRGIFIKWSFWRDKSTTLSEKALLLEIHNLSELEHGCIASNSHFSELMGIKKEAVSRLISSLEKKGLLVCEIKKGSRNHSRKITINKMLFQDKQNVISPLTNCLETKENKTTNKTINSVIEYLNSKANKRFNSKSKDALLIKQLIKDKYTLEDFKLVIDTKVSEWINDDEMKKFLRPSTLFGSKFDRYLNESIPTQTRKPKMMIGGVAI